MTSAALQILIYASSMWWADDKWGGTDYFLPIKNNERNTANLGAHGIIFK